MSKYFNIPLKFLKWYVHTLGRLHSSQKFRELILENEPTSLQSITFESQGAKAKHARCIRSSSKVKIWNPEHLYLILLINKTIKLDT